MKFIPRLNANDLKHNKFFNQWNGEYNPGFPEFAPLSVGGELTIDKGKYAGEHSKGNCTWYVWGRMAESGAYLPFPPRPFARGNAHEWGTHGEELTDKAELGSVVVFGDGGYGHVAFVERIDGNKVYVSESSYSERGNDFLFRCDRTVDQICKEWSMKVLRILKPLNKFESAPSSNTGDELKVGDSFTLKKGVVIYNDNPKPTEYTHQPTKDHPAVIVQESGEWYKIRVDVLDPTDVWVYKKDVVGKKEESKPKPKPASGKNAYGQSLKVGDPITFSRLYKTKDGEGGLNPDEMYYSKRNSKGELVGYGNIIAVLPNNHYTSYEVSSVKGGAPIGFVRFDNVY